MTQIDTSKWGKFKVGELFEFERGKEVAPNKNLSGDCPLILESGENNGYSRNVIPTKIFDGNVITVSVNYAANVFYQENKFCASVNIIILRNKYLNKYSGLFIAAILSKNNLKYNYNNKVSKDKLFNEIVPLPVTPEGTPDFDYMEDYMKEITKLAVKRIEKVTGEKPQTKIDTSKWGKFRVGDLFEIKPTKSYKMRNADLLDGGNTPVVVNSAFNNGIGGFTTQEPTEKGGIITFSDTVDANTIFYQEKPFAGYSHVQGVYPVGEWANEWDKYSLLFFASCFKSTALRYGFDYSNKFRRDVALELKVLLPQTPDHTPDFDYMEDYMKEITKLAAKKVEKLKGEKPQTKIDTSNWKKFKVGELFDVANGKKYPSSIRQTGELPLISTTANNNGISDYIKDRNDGVYSNCITVAYSGSVGATFYHKEKVFVGETVIALLPKFKMNQYSGLFICSILSKINSKFSYTQKIKVLQYKNEAISLPVTPEGTPDFDYMENYMKEITEKAKKKI